jgi:hypothetical protein
MGRKPRTIEQTKKDFLSRIIKAGECWLWTGPLDKDGYGHSWDGSRRLPAHCFSYISFVSPIPFGFDAHHTCIHRHCVNPNHLELISHSEHNRLHALKDGRKPPSNKGRRYVQDRTQKINELERVIPLGWKTKWWRAKLRNCQNPS